MNGRRLPLRGTIVLALILVLALVASHLAKAVLPRSLFQSRRNSPPAAGADYQRIVSLSPSITETLYALGLGDRVGGVTRYCTFPPEVQAKTKVGGFLDPSLETLVALRPDLVVMLTEHEASIPGLRELAFHRLVVNHRSLEGILESIATIGRQSNRRERAEALLAELRSRMAAVQRATAASPRVRVMLCVDRTRGTGGITDCYVAGPDGYLDQLITLAGGQNVFADELAPFPVVSVEGILHANPEVVVELAAGQEEHVADLRADWASLPGLAAVRVGRVHVITDGFAPIPGPRFVLLLERLQALLTTSAGR